MASMTSFPRSAPAGMLRYLPSGRARITVSASSAASLAVVAIAPGARISTVRRIASGAPEPAIGTRYPAATASLASTVPTLPAPRMPIVRIIDLTRPQARAPSARPLSRIARPRAAGTDGLRARGVDEIEATHAEVGHRGRDPAGDGLRRADV